MMWSFILSEVQKDITTSPDLIFSSSLQTGSVCDLSAGTRPNAKAHTERHVFKDLESELNQKKYRFYILTSASPTKRVLVPVISLYTAAEGVVFFSI